MGDKPVTVILGRTVVSVESTVIIGRQACNSNSRKNCGICWTVYSPLFFHKIATITRKLRNGCHLCLYCERNLERGRQSTEGAGVGDMNVGGRNARKIVHSLRRLPPWWIVVLSPGCARNINKDGARFRVCVRSWRSYGKTEDCKQSRNLWNAQ